VPVALRELDTLLLSEVGVLDGRENPAVFVEHLYADREAALLVDRDDVRRALLHFGRLCDPMVLVHESESDATVPPQPGWSCSKPLRDRPSE